MRLTCMMLWAAACTSEPSLDQLHQEAHQSALQFVRYQEATHPADIVIARLPAEVISSPGGHVALAPRATAKLIAWLIAPGMTLRAGQAMARVDSPELDTLLQELKAYKMLETQATARVKAGVAPASEVALVQTTLAGLEARQRNVQHHFKRRGDGWEWLSRRAGSVQRLSCTPGSPISPSTVCLDLIDTQKIRVQTHVPEQYLHRLQTPHATFYPDGKAAPIALDWDAWAPAIEPASRTRVAWFAPTLSDQPSLLPGRSGRIDIAMPTHPGIVHIASDALTRMDGRDVVFIKGQELPVSVEILGRDADGVVISGQGIKAGTQIAIRGVLTLKSKFIVAADHH